MMERLDEVLESHKVAKLLEKQKNMHLRADATEELAERIKYRVEAADWLIYIDGNTFRDFIRGFAFCSSGVSFCDDNGDVYKISISQLKSSNISNAAKSVLINGKSITLGPVSSIIANILTLIKRDLNADSASTKRPVKMANFGTELWYVGYEGEVSGPFEKKNLQEKINNGEYDLEALQVWKASMTDWKLISDVKDFSLPSTLKVTNENLFVAIDINSCAEDELRKLPGLTKERIAAFIKKRNAGIYLKNLYDLQEAFELKPHEVERLKQMITFKLTNAQRKKGRILDM